MPSTVMGAAFERPSSRWSSWRIALLCVGVLGVGCSGGFKMPAIPGLSGAASGDGGPEQSEVRELVFDQWHKDSIHCAENHCENVYALEVSRPGSLRAEVYAPWGADTPEIDLALLDPSGVAIARPVKPNARPRRVESRVEPGRYFLRVRARGGNEGRLKYDLVAKLNVVGKPPASAPAPRRRTPAPVVEPKDRPVVRPVELDTAVAPAPAPQRRVLVTAEVLDIEEEGGGAAFVLLDAGAPDRVAAQMRGRLMEQGVPIGEIVIVEVYADGSRARVIGALTGEVGIDTVAEIFHSHPNRAHSSIQVWTVSALYGSANR